MKFCELRSIGAGQILCKEGDRSSEIYFIKEGALEIIKEIQSAQVRLSKLNSGAMTGEMAFYTGNVRSATIRASENALVYVLNGASFKSLRSMHPLLASKFDIYVIKRLSTSLMRANKFISSLK